jgi:hypothetical protein
MSVPSSAIGSAISWIGKASVMPTSSKARVISALTPSSEKLVRMSSFRQVLATPPAPVGAADSGAHAARPGTSLR